MTERHTETHNILYKIKMIFGCKRNDNGSWSILNKIFVFYIIYKFVTNDRQTDRNYLFFSPVLVDHPVISQSLRILWNTYPSVSSINSLKRGNFCMPVSNKTSIKPYHKHIFIWIIKLKYQVTGKQTNKCTQLQESLKGNIPPRKYNK